VGGFLVIDLAFLGANLVKVPQGGWFALVAGVAVFTIMTTWRRGRRALTRMLLANALPVETFLRQIQREPPLRVPGTAVFMHGNQAGMPPALLHNVRHNHVLHERNILLTAKTTQTPRVEPDRRMEVE